MGTIADALQNATDAVNNLAARMNLLRDGLAAQVASVIFDARAAALAVVNRPGIRVVYIDPVNGSEDNPGTLASPRKDLDAVLATTGLQFSLVYLMGDTTIRKRHEIFAPFVIYGIQKAQNTVGFVNVDRQVSFLGLSENSPRATGENDCAGVTIYGQNFQSGSISYRLPELPGGLTIKSHLNSNSGASVTIVGGTVSAVGASAGALIGSLNQKMSVFLSTILGSNAAGHLFDGVAAGQNPNNIFPYTTNVTTA